MARKAERQKVVLLFGPTGVGKTQILEDYFSGRAEVISADALQVYRRLDIGTAKPSARTLGKIPHHLIDIHDFHQNFNVGDFCRLADMCIHDIASRNLLPIISGGTAYYMKSWLMGMPKTPLVEDAVRKKIADSWQDQEPRAIREYLCRVDPVSASKIGANDRYRMLRALEVLEQSGKPLSEFPLPDQPRDDYDVMCFGLYRSKDVLHRRIEQRIDNMIQSGLKAEVDMLRHLGACREHPAMKGIGYREWFGTADNPHPTDEEVRHLILRNTRRYAKRQITFFKSLPKVVWLELEDDINAKTRINKFRQCDDWLDQIQLYGHNPV